MTPRRGFWERVETFLQPLAFGLLCFIIWSPGVFAQAGGISGRILNADGEGLAEVEVVLEGKKGLLSVQSDERGRFRFLDLVPGNYSLAAAQDGYCRATYTPVNVRLGRTTHIAVRMSDSVEETVVVTSEPPKPAAVESSPRTVLPTDELGEIPSSEDPWTTAAKSSGVLIDENSVGQRGTAWIASGSDARQNGFAIDGEVVGETLTSYHPNETSGGVQVSSGGVDVRVSGSGALLNLITPRGHNDWRGAVRSNFSDQGWQSAASLPVGSSDDLIAVGDDISDVSVSRMLSHLDLGGDFGGRLIRDHVWFWGALSGQDIERQAVGGLSDQIRLQQWVGKLHSQLDSTSSTFSYYFAERDQIGLGAGPDRSATSLLRDLEPNRFLRFENTHIFSSKAMVLGSWSNLDRDAWSTPLGEASSEIVLNEDGVWLGYGDFRNAREAETWRLEAVFSRPVVGADQDIRVGSSHGDVTTESSERWGNESLLHLAGENFGTPFDLVRVTRPSTLKVSQNDVAFWLQDSIRWKSVTLDLGLRHEVQRGRNLAGQVEANPLFPELLPALDYSGDGSNFTWNSVSPRLGLAWGLGKTSRTVLRASYASFASRLYPDLVSRVNPLASSEVTLGFEDLGNDQAFDPEDPFFVVDHAGVDLRSAASPISPNVVDPVLNPERTDEWRLSAEHRFGSEIKIGLDYQHRQLSNVLELRRLIRDGSGNVRVARTHDYLLDTLYTGLLPNGEPYIAPVYSLRSSYEYTGGNLLANGDRQQEYEGLTFRVERPLSNRWMLRGYFTWSDWRWRLGDDFTSFDDPTNTVDQRSDDAGISLADSHGDVVAPQVAAGGEDQFFNSRWAFNLFSLYQVAPNRPWGFQLAANVHAREGYPIPYSITALASDQSVRSVQVTTQSDAFRLEDVYTVDLRLEKSFRLGGARATFSVEGFNLMNEGYVLERERQLNSPQANHVRQTLSPRMFKAGFRIGLE